jgi:hypothetical protein
MCLANKEGKLLYCEFAYICINAVQAASHSIPHSVQECKLVLGASVDGGLTA